MYTSNYFEVKITMKINGLYVEEKTPDAVLGGCIEIFNQAWPVNPLTTINALEQECSYPDSGVFWQKAPTIGAGAFQNHRTNLMMDLSYVAEISGNYNIQTIHNLYYTMILSASNSYARRFRINEPFFHEGYQVLKYSGGQEYLAHYDGGTDTGRCLTAICYLNDNYTGGEIEFPNFGIKIKPEPGMLILFPSNYAYQHIAHPVTEGTKYAIVTWIRDRNG